MSIAKKLASQTAIYGVSSIVGAGGKLPAGAGLYRPLRGSAIRHRYGAIRLRIVSKRSVHIRTGNHVFRFANRPGEDRRALYSRTLSLLLLSSAGLTALLMLLARPLLGLLHLPPGHDEYAIWIALILGLDAVAALPFARLRLENKARKFATIRLTNILLNVGLNLFFIVLCPPCCIARPAARWWRCARWWRPPTTPAWG